LRQFLDFFFASTRHAARVCALIAHSKSNFENSSIRKRSKNVLKIHHEKNIKHPPRTQKNDHDHHVDAVDDDEDTATTEVYDYDSPCPLLVKHPHYCAA
jgi:translation initiation factor IF-3